MLCVYLREEAESSFPTINKPIALCHIGGELGLPSAALMMSPNGGMSGHKKPEVLGKALHSSVSPVHNYRVRMATFIIRTRQRARRRAQRNRQGKEGIECAASPHIQQSQQKYSVQKYRPNCISTSERAKLPAYFAPIYIQLSQESF